MLLSPIVKNTQHLKRNSESKKSSKPLKQPAETYTNLTEEFYFFYKTLQPGGFFRDQYKKSKRRKNDHKPRRDYQQAVEKLKNFIDKSNIQKITFRSDLKYKKDHKHEIENEYIIEYIIRFIRGTKISEYKYIRGKEKPVHSPIKLPKGDKYRAYELPESIMQIRDTPYLTKHDPYYWTELVEKIYLFFDGSIKSGPERATLIDWLNNETGKPIHTDRSKTLDILDHFRRGHH